jgi:hypothetical protein
VITQNSIRKVFFDEKTRLESFVCSSMNSSWCEIIEEVNSSDDNGREDRRLITG